MLRTKAYFYYNQKSGNVKSGSWTMRSPGFFCLLKDFQ